MRALRPPAHQPVPGPASASWLHASAGSVEVGKPADLAIVRGNPLIGLKNAANVEYVVKTSRPGPFLSKSFATRRACTSMPCGASREHP